MFKELLKASPMTQTQLAKTLGVNQSNVSMNMGHDNPSINTVLAYLEILGYELVVQPKKPGRRPDGQILITKED